MGMTVDIEVFHPAKPSSGSDPWQLLPAGIRLSEYLFRRLEAKDIEYSRSLLVEDSSLSRAKEVLSEVKLDYVILEDRLIDLVPQAMEFEGDLFSELGISPEASSLSCRQGIIFWNLLRLGRLKPIPSVVSELSSIPKLTSGESKYVVSILPDDYEELEGKIVANTLSGDSFAGRIHGIFLNTKLLDSDLQRVADEVIDKIMSHRGS